MVASRSSARCWPCTSPIRSCGSASCSRSTSASADGHAQRLALGDERDDHERLASRRRLGGQEGFDLRQRRSVADLGADRRRPGGSSRMVADRQVAVEGERQRARDGRRGQRQQVRLQLRRPWPAARPAAPRRIGAARRPRPGRAWRTSTASLMTAWVPITTSASPAAIASWISRLRARRQRAGQELGADARAPRAAAPARWWCWRARISVGAISAACQPARTTPASATAATAVLPLPTSPCSSRRIGWSAARSATISSTAAALVAGQREGQRRDQRLQARSASTATGAAR